MYNDTVFQTLLEHDGCTVADIIEYQGLEQSRTNKSRIQRKLRSLEKYGIVRVERVPNPIKSGIPTVKQYWITDATRQELER